MARNGREVTTEDGRTKRIVRALYESHEPFAIRFRYALITFDVLSIAYFIVTTPMPVTGLTLFFDSAIGVVIALDTFCRFWISRDRRAHFRRVYVLADLIVLTSLVLERFVEVNLTFLRILRALRLVHSYHLVRDLRVQSRFFREHEDTVIAVTNLLVFVFFTTAVVFALAFEEGHGFEEYVDALYFTVTTLTTTGYGDITPTSAAGKLLAVLIMVVGVSLFVNLARAIFMPSKVRHDCPECGLQRHDPDAVHCKHCGIGLNIKTDGAS